MHPQYVQSWPEFSTARGIDPSIFFRLLDGHAKCFGDEWFDVPAGGVVSHGHWALRNFVTCVPACDNKYQYLARQRVVELNGGMRGWIVLRLAGQHNIHHLAHLSKANLLVAGGDPDRSDVMSDPHLIYFLERAVCFSKKGLPGPIQKYHHVRRALAALARASADDELSCRNPLSPLNRALIGYGERWTLSALEKHFKLMPSWLSGRAHGEKPASIPELGRTGSTAKFDEAKLKAASTIRQFWPDRPADFEEEIYQHLAFVFAGDDLKDLRRRAASAASYFWRTFDPTKVAASARRSKWKLGRDREETAGQPIKLARAIAGANTSRLARSKTLELIVDAIELLTLRYKGERPCRQDVVAFLAGTRSQSTVYAYWARALEIIENDGARRIPERSCFTVGRYNRVLREGDEKEAGDYPEAAEDLEKIKERQVRDWILNQRGTIFRDTADPELWCAAASGYWQDRPPSYFDPDEGREVESGEDWFVGWRGEHWVRHFDKVDGPVRYRDASFVDELFESDLMVATRKNEKRAEMRELREALVVRRYRRAARLRFGRSALTADQWRDRIGGENIRRSLENDKVAGFKAAIRSRSRRTAAGVWQSGEVQAERARAEAAVKAEKIEEVARERRRYERDTRRNLVRLWGPADGDWDAYRRRCALYCG